MPHPTHCGFFRCDTFVNYVFHWGNYTLPTYNPPGSPKNATIPRYVFNAFPHGNGDGPLSLEASTVEPNILTEISINSATSTELAEMSPEEFFAVVDVSNDNITSDGVKNLLSLAQDPILSVDKRTFLMDKLGFVGTADMVPKLIQLYDNLINKDDLPIKNQIIASSLNLYQRYSLLKQYPQEKAL